MKWFPMPNEKYSNVLHFPITSYRAVHAVASTTLIQYFNWLFNKAEQVHDLSES
jgi:hypothetical protein